MSRHNDYYSNRDGGSDGSGADPGNPWGNRPPGGGSLGRALQRLLPPGLPLNLRLVDNYIKVGA